MGGDGTWHPAGCTCDPMYHQRRRFDGKLTACFLATLERQASWRSGKGVLESLGRRGGSPPPPRLAAGQTNQVSVAEKDSSIDDIRLVAFPCDGRDVEETNQWWWSNHGGCSGSRPVKKKTAKGLLRAGMEPMEWTPRTKMGQKQERLLQRRKDAHEGTPGKRNGHHLLRASSTLISRPHFSLACPLSAASFESTRAGLNVYPSGQARARTRTRPNLPPPPPHAAGTCRGVRGAISVGPIAAMS
jgi:hypothetical protein